MSKTINYYTKNAEQLSEQYDSLAFEDVHKDWMEEIPKSGFVLDVGAGSGRDARYLASKGLTVYAVEPADGIRERAQSYEANSNIQWLDDSLPALEQVHQINAKFDLILLSAIWMHIPPSSRERSFRKLSSLLNPNGKLVISLRHGSSPDERKMYPVSKDELANLAQQFGLSLSCKGVSQDKSGRHDVYWETVVLTLPDDGTGAFPLIRNIVINDHKSSTYKVALLRTLLRIAEGHPGAVLERTPSTVKLPLGLIALYWLKLYKPLVDTLNLKQGSGSRLGFVKANGWKKLTHFHESDFYIGRCVFDQEEAESLHQTLKDISTTIKNMPVKYITLPGTEQAIFNVETSRTTKPKSSLLLDFNYLKSLGQFEVPADFWEVLSRFSVWIEPALVNEWARLMESYPRNKERGLHKTDYLNALNWENPERNTGRIRQRVAQLLSDTSVQCCWSGKDLARVQYAIDHAFPFARWPNNDLWNLLPAQAKLNNEKSDKLPTRQRMKESQKYIVSWWDSAWKDNKEEFFTQANFALPNLQPNNRNTGDIFEAMLMQRDRIKQTQQLADW
ncbi:MULTISPECIES: class I SAM-dependent methyltransferase [Gammaproteobacteria]|uniref:class I SAM-dependent methyltransferase n=1 Tax=Gammaproteobacteria TaxID=1236 RepID=UPI000DD0A023|nr:MULTISPECIES: class I SAM-dependent methyltransferase [Gammaproteobacteria]RTE85866.1 methyltransferase domain-containing protein [Aliidiomarina sp. B3213]TCZ90134.1 methyltransferase domain-containing protein [Lysobacter sp. N42]